MCVGMYMFCFGKNIVYGVKVIIVGNVGIFFKECICVEYNGCVCVVCDFIYDLIM